MGEFIQLYDRLIDRVDGYVDAAGAPVTDINQVPAHHKIHAVRDLFDTTESEANEYEGN
jgi:hypothetical protein